MNAEQSPSPTRTCQSCGAPAATDGQFCERCGASLSGQPGVHTLPSPPAMAPIAPVQPAMPAAAPSPAFSAFAGQTHLIGAASPNETYLGNRLSYADASTNFDPLTNVAYRQALASAFWATVAAWLLGSLALFAVFGFVGIYQQLTTSYFEGDSSISPVLVIWQLLWLAFSLVLAILFWIRRLPVQLTEWMLTVDGKGFTARHALDHMYTILSARQTPVRTVQVVRLAPAGQQPRDYLRLDDALFTGFVSSFGYGTDLFIGWTFWLNVSPARWLLRHLERLFRGDGAGIYGSLVFDQPKAMREVMHSAVRQGVDIATGQTRPLGEGTIAGMSVPTVPV
jgi:hypothetical protein